MQNTYCVIVPAYNEEAIIGKSVLLLCNFLKARYGDAWKLVVADNGSTDQTVREAARAGQKYPRHVDIVHAQEPGRGTALRQAVSAYPATYYCYVDADVPLEIADLAAVLEPLATGAADVVVGSRRGKRPLRRRILTLALRIATFFLFDLKITDPQCGIKAFHARAAKTFLACRETSYFADTEFLAAAKTQNLQTAEVPVRWIEHRYPARRSKISFWRDSLRGWAALMRITRALHPHCTTGIAWTLGAGLIMSASYLLHRIVVSQPDFQVAHQMGDELVLSRVIGFNIFFALLCLLMPYALRRGRFLPGRLFVGMIISFSLVFAGIAAATHPTRSQDIYWNLLLAKGFATQGLNPYETTPFQLHHDPLFAPLQAWTHLPMTHGPLWVLIVSPLVLSAIPVWLTVGMAKVMAICVVLVTSFFFWRILALHNVPVEHRNVILGIAAWNPFLIQTAIIDVHNDVIIMAAIAASYYFLLRGRFIAATVPLLLGGMVKYVSLLLIAAVALAFWHAKRTVRHGLAFAIGAGVICVLLATVLYIPFGGIGTQTFSGMTNEMTERGSMLLSLAPAGFLFAASGLQSAPLRMLGLVLAGAIIGIYGFRKLFLHAYTIPYLAVFLFATPWFFPWYVLWVYPLLFLLLPLWSMGILGAFLTIIPEAGGPFMWSLLLLATVPAGMMARVARNRLRESPVETMK